MDWLNKYGPIVVNKYYKDLQVVAYVGNVFLGEPSYNDDFRTYFEIFEITDEGLVTIKYRAQDITRNEMAYRSHAFSLKDLDPSSLKISNDSFYIDCSSGKCVSSKDWCNYFEDNNWKDTYIEFFFSNNRSTREKLTNKFNSDPDVLRFRKALSHAIELFGDKTVKKDLFDGN